MKLHVTDSTFSGVTSDSTAYAVSDSRCLSAGPAAIVRDFDTAHAVGKLLFGSHYCLDTVAATMPFTWGVKYSGGGA